MILHITAIDSCIELLSLVPSKVVNTATNHNIRPVTPLRRPDVCREHYVLCVGAEAIPSVASSSVSFAPSAGTLLDDVCVMDDGTLEILGRGG